MKIRTRYNPPPIPIRAYDWSAIDEDTYEGPQFDGERFVNGSPIGFGHTEEEAIAGLLEQLEEAPARH